MNLLRETIEILEDNGKCIMDVEWFGTTKYTIDADIQALFDVDYDDGYGLHQIDIDLIVVGKGFWLERHEYDGSEWWEYKSEPNKPKESKSFGNLLTEVL